MLGKHIARPARWMALAVIPILLILALPATAFAATGPWSSVTLTLVRSQSGGTPVLLVAGRLPSKAVLPAKVNLAIPPGAEIGWAGEILGGDSSKDPTVKYTVTKGTDYDIVSFTLSQARTGQVEVSVPGAISPSGGDTQARFSWKAPYDIPKADLSILLPQGASVTSGTPGAKTVNSASDQLYELTVSGISKGQPLTLAVTYKGGTTSAGGASSPGQTQPSVLANSGSYGRSPAVIAVVLGLLLTVTYFVWKYFSAPVVAYEESGGGEVEEADDEEEWPEDD